MKSQPFSTRQKGRRQRRENENYLILVKSQVRPGRGKYEIKVGVENGERIDQQILEPVSPSTIKPENKSFFDDQASFLKEAKPDFNSFNRSLNS